VGWNGSAWRVQLDADLGDNPEFLLWVIGHELGHIVRGTAQKVGNAETAEAHRRAFVGAPGPDTEYIRSTWAGRHQSQDHQRSERRMDRWADAFCSEWWDLLVDCVWSIYGGAQKWGRHESFQTVLKKVVRDAANIAMEAKK
jgi:hypothetical protein